MKALKVPLLILALVLAAGVGFVYAGFFNVAADEPHWALTLRLMEATREQSIAARARNVAAPPNLSDSSLIAAGGQEYAEMCTDCHLAPGKKETEMRAGLYPKPPNLAEHGLHRKPAETFWIIKHGLKMTGMPAWGVTHDDGRIWSMVAFLQKLPELTPAQYEALVGEEGGAGHMHRHGEEESDHEHDGAATLPEKDEAEGHHHGEEADEHGGSGLKAKPDAKPKASEPSGGHSHSAGDAPSPNVPSAKPSTQAAMSGASAEPVAVVERFFSALAAGNEQAASAQLDPNVLIYESGGAERSREAYASHHLPNDAQFLKVVKHRLLSRTGDAVGDWAWVASEASFSGTVANRRVNLISTETMILRKSASAWRIVHIHWSNRPAAGGA